MEGPWLALHLPHAGDQRRGLLGVDGEICAAGTLIHVQDLRPRRSKICRLVHTTIGTLAPELAKCCHVDRTRVTRIDNDPCDTLCRSQTTVRPGHTGIGGPVDAVTGRHTIPNPGLTGAHPDGVGPLLVDGDRSDGLLVLIKDGLEGRSAVQRFPDTATGSANVEDGAVRIDHGDIGDTATHGCRTDGTGAYAAKHTAGETADRTGSR